MQNIKLLKVEVSEINVLKNELFEYITYKTHELSHIKESEKLFNEMLLIDLSYTLFHSFDKKIENKRKNQLVSITLNVKDAVTLIHVCSFKNTLRKEMEIYTTGKFIRLLDKELKNLILN